MVREKTNGGGAGPEAPASPFSSLTTYVSVPEFGAKWGSLCYGVAVPRGCDILLGSPGEGRKLIC